MWCVIKRFSVVNSLKKWKILFWPARPRADPSKISCYFICLRGNIGAHKAFVFFLEKSASFNSQFEQQHLV